MYNFAIRCTIIIRYMTLREYSQQYYCVHHSASWCYTHYTGQTTQHQAQVILGPCRCVYSALGGSYMMTSSHFQTPFIHPMIDLKLNSSGVPLPNPPSLFITLDKEKYEDKGQKSHKSGAKWVTGTQKVHKSVLIHEIIPAIIRMSTGTRATTSMTRPVFFATSRLLLMWW